MDTYLEIAERVLLAAKRPMSPRSILAAAYRADVVPPHLYGKTQHKTLQARLSEDILRRRINSRFYRTEPGKFFLRSFITDPRIDDRFKEPFSARRRTRDLTNEPVLALNRSVLKSAPESLTASWLEFLGATEHLNAVRHVDAKKLPQDFAIILNFTMVVRSNSVLSYRVGRYRDDRDRFANKRSIGFTGPVPLSSQTLFCRDDLGASDAALETILLDLDISISSLAQSGSIERPEFKFFMPIEDGVHDPVLLLVMSWTCPSWFEPTTRRLSINDPVWLDLEARPNNIDDFEIWSQKVLELLLEPDDHLKTA